MLLIVDLLQKVYEVSGSYFEIAVTSFLIVSVLILLLIVLVPGRPANVPPGPPSRLPLLGNLLELVTDPDTRKNLVRLRNQYGDIYSLQMGTKTVVVLSGYDVIKEALIKRADVCSGRPSDFVSDKVFEKKGIIGASGRLWKEQRTFALKSLRELGFGKSSLENKIQEEIIQLLKEIEHHFSSPFNVERVVSTSLANVISAIAFGGNFKHGDPTFDHMMKLLDQLVELLGFGSLLNFLPYLIHVPGDLLGAKKIRKNYSVIYGYMRSEIERQMGEKNNGTGMSGNFISSCVQELKDGEECSITIDQLTRVLFDLFGAGTETTTSAIRWALIYLVNNQDMHETMLAEIDNHVGRDCLPSLQDRKNLVYTEAFIMETLRHSSMITLNIPHGVSEDVKIRGFLIPKNAMVLVDLHSAMHDPECWTEPEKFNPERFIDSEGRLTKPEQYIPFGIGRRSCLGESLAKMEMFLIISALVQNFRFQAPPYEDLSLPAVDGVFGAIHKPKQYNIVAVPRKSCKRTLIGS